MVDFPQRVLNARASLCRALQEHHAYVSKHTEILQLADELETLKDLLPSSSGLQAVSIDGGDLSISASAAHANAVSSLHEALDMYSNCLYLLEVHRSIDLLSSAVRQLCQCIRPSHAWESEPGGFGWNDIDDQDDGDAGYTSEQCAQDDNRWESDRERRAEVCEIDDDSYRLCSNAVVSALADVEELINRPAKFNKDNTLVFQGFCRTLRDCRMTLNEHIDSLWRQWFVWYTSRGTKTAGGQLPVGLPQLLAELRLSASGATVPSTTEMTELCHRLGDHQSASSTSADWGSYKRVSSVLASFTVLARPKLLTQLFRLTNAVGDPSGRFRELSSVLWTHVFEPWLDKVPCTSGSSRSDIDWPVLRVRHFDESAATDRDTVYNEGNRDELPKLLPAWRLELVPPDFVSDRNDNLILVSCRQLASAFHDLSTHLFSLNEACPVPMNDLFDEHLVRRLIDGRFTSVLPPALKCQSLDFLAPVTQAVCSLASAGKETGFFTGVVDDDALTDSRVGGATTLVCWVRDLSRLSENRRTAEVLAQVRSLLADPEQFRFTQLAGAASCTKPQNEDGSLEFSSEETELDEIEMRMFQRQSADVSTPSCGTVSSLSHLLESKENRHDLARYLDLGHFHFPLCKVSKSVFVLMELIRSVISEAEAYLDRLRADSEPTPLAAAIVELVPRLILSYTSLVPTFHGTAMEKDLYLTSLYHNNCMFLAHECLILGETCLYPMLCKIQHVHPDQAPSGDSAGLEQLASVSTCILVPHLRTSGTDMLLRRLRDFREQLRSELKGARGFRDLGVADNRHRCTTVMNNCFDLLRAASSGLKPLPLAVYFRCLGVLCNFACKEVTDNVLRLIDLTTQDCDALVDLLKDLEIEVDQYFIRCPDPELRPPEKTDSKNQSFVGLVTRRVPHLARLRGLLAVLTAPTMAVIECVLWNQGRGPLASEHHLKAAELRALIEAVYIQSGPRDQFLSQLH